MGTLRNYATIEQIESFADIDITDNEEGYERIEMAEELIDDYLGPVEKHVSRVFHGIITAVSGLTISDTSSDTPLDLDDGYLKGCVIEIIGGTGAGQIRRLTNSDKGDKSVTIADAWTTAPVVGSAYKIYQLAKFPRRQDAFFDADSATWHKSIPLAIQRATAAQLKYMISMTDAYFAGQDSEMDSETIMSYGYNRGPSSAGQSARVRMVSPRARALLRGLKVSTGTMIV